jgi:hypothetical protein
MNRLFLGVIACLALLAGSAVAQAQNTTIRGTIAAVDGKQVSIKANNGDTVGVVLPADVRVSVPKPFSMAEIKDGMNLGITTVKRPDGTIVALEVHPIQATSNLGLSPSSLAPDATMTNGAFEGTAKDAKGGTITVNYKTGTAKILIVPDTVFQQNVPGTRDDLKPGAPISLVARKDGEALTAVRMTVGKDGLKPAQ